MRETSPRGRIDRGPKKFDSRYEQLFERAADGRCGMGVIAPPGSEGKGRAATRPSRRENNGRGDSRRRSRSRDRRRDGGESRAHGRAKSRDRKGPGAMRASMRRARERNRRITPKGGRWIEDNRTAGELSMGLGRGNLVGKHDSQPSRWEGSYSTAVIVARYGFRSICAIRAMGRRDAALLLQNEKTD